MCEAAGLRAAEFLAAVRGDVRTTRAGALLDVIGKGAKHREVPLPKGAQQATRMNRRVIDHLKESVFPNGRLVHAHVVSHFRDYSPALTGDVPDFESLMATLNNPMVTWVTR